MSDAGETEAGEGTRELAWYRQLLEQSSDIVLVLDRNRRITYVSSAVKRRLGHEPESLTGKKGLEYVYAGDRDAVEDAIEETRTSPETRQTVEFRYQQAENSWCWLEATVYNGLDDEYLDGFLLNCRDITERKEQTAELRTTKERMEMALEGANLGVWDWDMETDEVSRDELLAEMLGYTQSEMGGHLRGWEQIVHPEGEKRHNEALAHHVENRTPYYQCEYRLKTKSGNWKWVRTMGKVVERADDGTPTRAVGLHQDIDDRKLAELKLEAERDMFREGPAVVFKWEDAEGWPVKYVSENVRDIFGYDPEALQSNEVSFADLIHEDDLEQVVRQVAEYQKEEAERMSLDPYRIVTADGHTRWVMEYTRDLQEEGETSHLLGYLVDITERKQRERELQQFKKAVEQSAHAIYITDVEGTIEYVNPAFENVTGYSTDEAVGRTPRILKSGEHGEEFYEEFWDTILAGERWESEVFDESADGEQVVLNQTVAPITDEEGNVEKFVAVARDITERKRYEDALEEAREELRQVIDLSPDLIFARNSDGEFLLANETTAEAFGMSRDGVREPTEPDNSLPDRFAEFDDADREVVESGEAQFVPEKEITTAADETRILQTTKVPFESVKTDQDAVLSYARDVTALKEREYKLREREQKYRSLFEDMRDALMLFDRDGYVDCNERALELFGIESVESFLEYTPWDLAPATQPDGTDSKETALSHIETAFDDGEAFFEFTHQRADGTEFPAEVKLSRFEHGDEPVLHALVREISDRKRQKRELEERESKYRSLFEETRDALMLLDRDGFFDCNERALDLFGLDSVESFTEYSPWELSPSTQPDGRDSKEAAQSHVETAFEEGQAFFEWRHERVDGESFPAEVKLSRFEHGGEPVLHALVRDISERKQRQRELERSRERYRSLFENNPIVLWEEDISAAKAYVDDLAAEIDDLEAYFEANPGELQEVFDRVEIRDVNQNATDYYGVESKETLLEGFSPFVTEDGLADVQSMWASIAAGETEFRREVVSETSDGAQRHELLDVYIPDPGDYSRVYITAIDITERKQYEKQLEEQRDNLDILNQVLRHDIRNDIQLIMAHAELLEQKCDDVAAQDSIETVLENANHAVELTTSAREMAEVMVSVDQALQEVNLKTILEGEIREVQSTYSEAVVTDKTSIPSVLVQANDMLGSVFRNLLKNAVQHNDTEVPEVTISATERENKVVVRVADNGPGVPDAQKETIFGKGEKGLDSHGTGIGLYLVQTLVESYGGDIWVEDRCQQDSSTGATIDADSDCDGAVFIVELPKISG
ncbi:MAG: PAS domain S-box protein [Haloarculaceae archaeon]